MERLINPQPTGMERISGKDTSGSPRYLQKPTGSMHSQPSATDTIRYVAQMTAMIIKIISLSSRPALGETERDEMALAWTEALQPIVPIDDLVETYKQAVADHQSEFPINVFNLKSAHKKVIELREKNRLKLVQTVQACSRYPNHDKTTATVRLANPVDVFGDEIDLPCPYCRQEAYNEARTVFLREANAKEQTPMETLTNLLAFRGKQ